jgi:hypothetical protein
MGNPQRGHVTLTAGEASYTLAFSVNALCSLEEATGQSVNEIGASMADQSRIKMTTIRLLLWGALLDHHEGVTIKQAGDIASEAGMQATGEAIGKAFALAFPEAKEDAGSRPRKAGKAGAG